MKRSLFVVLALISFAAVAAPLAPADAASASKATADAQRKLHSCQSKARAEGLSGLEGRVFVADCLKA
jgi:hypothetical protein